ncbi:MAG: cation diffusion facilitator family transporter [candidate division WOR-3 bacterium]
MNKEPSLARQLVLERQVTFTGLIINILLTAGKITAGILGASSAIIADGLHSLSDLASDIAVLWGISAAKQPPDEDHHYGHSRYETIVALFVGILLVAAALFVAGEAILTLSQRHTALRNWVPFYMAIASIILKELLYWWTRAVGRRFHNPAIIANAWHHRSDAFSSIAAAFGIGGALIGGERWSFLDHLTAVILASFLVYIGIRIIRSSLQKLSDRAPEPKAIDHLHQTISQIPGVKSFHAFRARHAGAGNLIEMDVHIQVDPEISVRAGHEIATKVEEEIRRSNPDVKTVVVHIEPHTEPETQ